MFSANTFVALLVFVAPFLVRADVMPTIPALGDIYNEGSSCPVAWDGDTNSTTRWKNMAILLMAGNNFEMEFITTIATSIDGTVSGSFIYPCPNVTPNSAIYFYQYIAPAEVNNSPWVVTGRFAIATSSGLTTPPANSTQPDGTDIPWGTGELVNPNNADALPSFASSIFLASSIVSNSSSTLAVVTSSTTGSATPVITSAGATSSASPASPTAQSTSGAMTTFDIRVLGAAAAVTLALSFVW